MKDLLIAFKIYLQTIANIRSGDEVKGDKEVLKILKKELKKQKQEDKKWKN